MNFSTIFFVNLRFNQLIHRFEQSLPRLADGLPFPRG
jgi:hypothetical protein